MYFTHVQKEKDYVLIKEGRAENEMASVEEDDEKIWIVLPDDIIPSSVNRVPLKDGLLDVLQGLLLVYVVVRLSLEEIRLDSVFMIEEVISIFERL